MARNVERLTGPETSILAIIAFEVHNNEFEKAKERVLKLDNPVVRRIGMMLCGFMPKGSSTFELEQFHRFNEWAKE